MFMDEEQQSPAMQDGGSSMPADDGTGDEEKKGEGSDSAAM